MIDDDGWCCTIDDGCTWVSSFMSCDSVVCGVCAAASVYSGWFKGAVDLVSLSVFAVECTV